MACPWGVGTWVELGLRDGSIVCGRIAHVSPQRVGLVSALGYFAVERAAIVRGSTVATRTT
jgi:hypothetical protein